MDLVTVPQKLRAMWIEEGDLPGQPATDEWAFYIGGGRPPIQPRERVYVVAHGRLRGYAPLVRVAETERGWALVRANDAVAVTIATPIPGFRGWRKVWWPRAQEVPFPDWMTAGLPEKRQGELRL
jgi:hypothetical protein